MADDVDDPVYEVEVARVRIVPVTTLLQWCRLTVSESSIECRTTRGTRIFQGHPSEFHSFAPALLSGFHLWHGRCRYRFMHFTPVPRPVAGVRIDVVNDRVRSWHTADALRQYVTGEPPAGLTVHPPLSQRAYNRAVLAAMAAMLSAIVLGICAASGASLLIGLGLLLATALTLALLYGVMTFVNRDR